MNSTQCLAPCFTSTQDHPFLSSSISSTSADQTASEAPSPPVSRRKRSVSFSSSSSSSSPSRCVIQAVCRRCRRLYGFGALNTFAMIKTILENVRAFAGSRPPIVLFLIFLSSLAATLFFITYYLRDNEIRDPSVENDWNLFLKNLANVDFCVLSRSNGSVFPSYNVSLAGNNDHEAAGSRLLSNASTAGIKSFSINVLLVIHPTSKFLAKSDNLTHLSGSVSGIHLGLTGNKASQAVLDISFELGRNRSLREKEASCTKKNFMHIGGRRCPDVVMPTCAHVSGPASLFPDTVHAPSQCVAESPSSTQGVDGNPVQTHARIAAHREIASSGWGAAPYCPRGPIAHTKFQLDPALTVFLGVEDRSVINLHLLHTSFFLVIMVFTVVCVAACKSHSHHNKSGSSNTFRPGNNIKVTSSSTNLGADQRGSYSLVA